MNDLPQFRGDHVNTLHGWLHKLSYLILDNVLEGHVRCEEPHPHSELVLDGDGDHLTQLLVISLKLQQEGEGQVRARTCYHYQQTIS